VEKLQMRFKGQAMTLEVAVAEKARAVEGLEQQVQREQRQMEVLQLEVNKLQARVKVSTPPGNRNTTR
jgi:uncharacterized coiled-coil protein SlyX